MVLKRTGDEQPASYPEDNWICISCDTIYKFADALYAVDTLHLKSANNDDTCIMILPKQVRGNILSCIPSLYH